MKEIRLDQQPFMQSVFVTLSLPLQLLDADGV
jgi:hypothetical protein